MTRVSRVPGINFSRKESCNAIRRGLHAALAKRNEATLMAGRLPKEQRAEVRTFWKRRIMRQAARTQAAAAIDAMAEARPLMRPQRKP